MKYILISDLHGRSTNPVARLDNAVETWFEKMNFVFTAARTRKAPIIQAGDVSDKPRDWIFLSRFLELKNKYKEVSFNAVYGQHDMYLYNRKLSMATVLGILEKSGYVTILGKTPVSFEEGVHIYGVSWGGEIPEVTTEGTNILSIHAPISDAPIYPDHEFTKDYMFLKKNPDFDLVICGDIHRSFDKDFGKRRIINTGPLLRSTAEEYNFIHSPHFAVWDSKTGEIEYQGIPYEPAETVISRKHLEDQQETEVMLADFVERLDSYFDSQIDFMSFFQTYIRKNKLDDRIVEILSEVMANVD